MADTGIRFLGNMEHERAAQSGENPTDISALDDFDFCISAEETTASGGRTMSNADEHDSMRNIAQSDVMLTDSERDDLIKTLEAPTKSAPGDVVGSGVSSIAAAAPAAAPLLPPPHHQTRSTTAKPRPIPVPKASGGGSAFPPSSQPSSQGSSGSAFLSSVLNPTGSTFNNTQLSHTPPTFGSSYEASHFGKRARSGSVSGRLRSASEYLEERGLLDRQTKGILKDLIIIGDEELQRAIDSYENGDPSRLEEMINSGALQNRLPNDIDILDDLDLDFLTMESAADGVGVVEGGNIEPIRSAQGVVQDDSAYLPSQQQQQQNPPGTASMPVFSTKQVAARNNMTLQQPQLMQPPQQQAQQRPDAVASTTAAAAQPYNDDGIGDLEFSGDLVSDQAEYLQLDQQSYGGIKEASAAASPAEASNLSEYEQRMRSNSLFSALLNDPKAAPPKRVAVGGGTAAAGNVSSQYGNWMDRFPDNKQRMVPMNTESAGQGPVANRRASAPSGIGASLEAERKRMEKLLKKEKREKAKQERKEKKEREKRKQKEEEEEHVHIPGSGMPRSLSDPNLRSSMDQHGLLQVERPEGWVGAYSPESRRVRIEKFMKKRNHRVWTKTVKYDVRKNFADSRLRVKGRFVKKEDEVLMRELMSLT